MARRPGVLRSGAGVQYLLALGRSGFIWVLGAGAVAEVLLLRAIGADLTQLAVALTVLQLTCAAVMLFISVRTLPTKETGPGPARAHA